VNIGTAVDEGEAWHWEWGSLGLVRYFFSFESHFVFLGSSFQRRLELA
jgi:hypothetical protein